MVYAVQVDKLEREVFALIAAGATVDGKPFTLAQARAQFDADLHAEPIPVMDRGDLSLRRALGVAR